jgi:SAM-dependent methyltransferase
MMIDTKTLNAYDSSAQQFADDWHAQPGGADLQALVRQYFLPGPTADVGCGSGRDTAWLSTNGFAAVGFDPSAALLAEAKRRYPELQFQLAMLPELDGVAENSFTNVLCETVIMHLEAALVGPAVRKLLAILQSGGILYLTWRVTENSDRRDEHGRLYSAFDPQLVLEALSGAEILIDEEKISASSGKKIHRIIARKKVSAPAGGKRL